MIPIVDTWNGCYPSAWKGIITPDSFKHPAKFSSRLIERIYRHAVEEGWLKPGDRVIDPFGGVALGAYPALRFGLDWTGSELEPRFVDLGKSNIELWNARYAGKLARWGSARLLQGDSRDLVSVISGAECAVSSPPYGETFSKDAAGNINETIMNKWGGGDIPPRSYSSNPNNLSNLQIGDFQAAVGSPPYATNALGNGGKSNRFTEIYIEKQLPANTYGATPGQLSELPPGDYQAAISSPPFIQAQGGCNNHYEDGPLADQRLRARHSAGNKTANAYGEAEGQLSNLAEGDYQAAISSPPFEDCVIHDGGPAWQQGGPLHADYGQSVGQLGQDHGETFWTAARQIVDQVYQVLAPGGHAIWVVKGYVKNRQLVDFPHQWQAVCEAVGFVTLHEHHALLVNHKGTSLTLDGEVIEHKTESKSFFRRLAEKNGSPRIDWETVLCMEKLA